jgi:hypothetical protein
MPFLFLVVMHGLYAQDVEHNYLVGPQFTDCDSLKFEGLSTEKAIELVRSVKFRYQQNFKLTRRTGFKGAEFYSCDLLSGILVIQFDNEQFLFTEVSKADWESLTYYPDPEGFYLDKKDNWTLFP